jgi:hypothetical protein
MKKSILLQHDYAPGVIKYIEEDLTLDIPFSQQEDCLREDLLQVAYGESNLILDVGWYPQGDIEGSFSIFVIKDYDWSSPVFFQESKTTESLFDAISRAITYCRYHNSD